MMKVLSAVAVALAVSGCGKDGGMPGAGGGSEQKSRNDLLQLGLAYISYVDANQKGPSKPADLLQFVENNQALIAAVENGTYVLAMNVIPIKLTTGTSNTVLGYQAAVPTSGGLVLMADGSTRSMTKDEFAAAPKAGK